MKAPSPPSPSHKSPHLQPSLRLAHIWGKVRLFLETSLRRLVPVMTGTEPILRNLALFHHQRRQNRRFWSTLNSDHYSWQWKSFLVAQHPELGLTQLLLNSNTKSRRKQKSGFAGWKCTMEAVGFVLAAQTAIKRRMAQQHGHLPACAASMHGL